MKIRLGYISNSSSSSFVIIAPEGYDWREKIEDETLKQLYERFRETKGTFNGQNVKIYRGWSDTSCGENTLSDTKEADIYCEKHNIDDDNCCEVIENLYFDFAKLFDKTCLYINTGD